MKVLATVLGALTLTVRVSAWYGSVTKGDDCGSGGCSGYLDLTDYNTGSTYWCGWIYPDSSSACSGSGNACSITCYETSPGGYNFPIQYWKTSDGCQNINFEGAFGGAGHGWCCDPTSCSLTA
ncbi:hypothetical protein DPV78_002044 [Talaromyces pinophilus]|nr:hypothetical protein DPV78_002044 [Talaromyces pinophilus]